LKALGDLFVQVLKLYRAAGLGHVSLDGTKVQSGISWSLPIQQGSQQISKSTEAQNQ
jgi:hypothetical protein